MIVGASDVVSGALRACGGKGVGYEEQKDPAVARRQHPSGFEVQKPLIREGGLPGAGNVVTASRAGWAPAPVRDEKGGTHRLRTWGLNHQISFPPPWG